MNNSIAFIITRMNWYRFFAPVIDAALQRGWHVECWHDVSRFLSGRAEDFPSKDKALAYPSGQPVVREFENVETRDKWIKNGIVDAVVDTIPPKKSAPFIEITGNNRTRFICLNANSDWHAYIKDKEEIDLVDAFALNTPYWLDQSFNIIRQCEFDWWEDALEKKIREKARFVGWPQLDQLNMISAEKVRSEYGIPEGRPVVVYFNWVEGYQADLRQRMFSAIGTRQRFFTIIRNIKQLITYVKFHQEPNLQLIMNGIRQFCDKNDALLLLKHRFRDKPTACEREVADMIISDESYYPHTIFKVLSLASLSIGYFSFAVRESISSMVPYVSLDTCGMRHLSHWGEKGGSMYDDWSQPGGPFNFNKVVSILKDSEVVNTFPESHLADYQFPDSAFKEYHRRFLSQVASQNSERFLDVVKHTINKH